MNDERILEALKALAREDRTCQAPRAVEARLRDQFRRNRSRNRSPNRSKLRSRRAALWTAAAVVVVAALSFAPGRRGVSQPALPRVEQAGHSSPGAGSQRPLTRSMHVKPAVNPHVKADVNSDVRPKPASLAIARSGQAPAADIDPNTGFANTGAANAGADILRSPRVEESATDFFPLMSPAPPFERGEILRVNVPASVMRTVGLPVQEERIGDRVQADIVVGEEGLPRAIRFVWTEAR